MAGRPRRRARDAAADAADKPRPPETPVREELQAERTRLQALTRTPSGLKSIRCTHREENGYRCPHYSVWGLDVCVEHGGLDPTRHEQLVERVGAMVEILDPRKLLIRGHQILDAHLGMITDPDNPGKFLPARDWPDEIWPAIRSIKILNYNAESGDGKTECVVEVQLHPQERYLELLMKNAGQLTEKLELTGKVKHEHTVGQEFADALREGISRVGPTFCPHCGKPIDEDGGAGAPAVLEAKAINVTPQGP